MHLVARRSTVAAPLYLDDSLTPAERSAAEALEVRPKSFKSTGNVVRLAKAKVTKQSLLEASLRLDDSDMT